jgi:hypothetical protein
MRMGSVTPAVDPSTTTTAPAPWYATVLTALTSVYQQNQINSINLQRAQQGLPPLDQSALAPTVNVGLPTAQMNQLMMIGGGALLLLLFMAMRRR